MKVLHVFHGQYDSGAEFVAFDCLGLSSCHEDYALVLTPCHSLISRLNDRLGKTRVIALDLLCEVNRADRLLLFGRRSRCLATQLPTAMKNHGYSFSDFDLIYYNNTIEAALASDLRPGRPEICHIHDMVSSLRPLVRRALGETIRRSVHVVTPSQAARKDILQTLNTRAPVTEVYNAPPFAFKEVPGELPFPLKRFAFFGGGIRRKGLDIVVAGLRGVAARSNQQGSAVTLDVYGAVDDKKRQRFLKAAGPVVLRFHGAVRHDAIPGAISDADAILLASRRDPLPSVILEALALGRPVFATEVDGIPEMISETEFLYRPNSASHLASCILDANQNSQEGLRASFQKCVSFAARRFQKNTKCSQIARIMKQAARAGTRTS
jgi:glycosyltransferase involved in cell wall biosynthesis